VQTISYDNLDTAVDATRVLVAYSPGSSDTGMTDEIEVAATPGAVYADTFERANNGNLGSAEVGGCAYQFGSGDVEIVDGGLQRVGAAQPFVGCARPTRRCRSASTPTA
jgi:hypothetical protein